MEHKSNLIIKGSIQICVLIMIVHICYSYNHWNTLAQQFHKLTLPFVMVQQNKHSAQTINNNWIKRSKRQDEQRHKMKAGQHLAKIVPSLFILYSWQHTPRTHKKKMTTKKMMGKLYRQTNRQ